MPIVEAPISNISCRATEEQKKLYRTAILVLKHLGRQWRYADDHMNISTFYNNGESVFIRLPELDNAMVFASMAWGAMTERYRYGLWVEYLQTLGDRAMIIAANAKIVLAQADSLRFAPIDDSNAFATDDIAEVA